jgi:hypothetical protein
MDRTASLRLEVRRFATDSGRTRALASLVNVGDLGGRRASLTPDPSCDAGLRADLVSRLLARVDGPSAATAWLTRGGALIVGDLDLAWFGAATEAFARHGSSDVPFHVVTRHGWLDVRTGEHRIWRRVRPLRRSS